MEVVALEDLVFSRFFIVLLYAQPVSWLTRLTIDDVLGDGDQILLRLGDPPSPSLGISGPRSRSRGQRQNSITAK